MGNGPKLACSFSPSTVRNFLIEDLRWRMNVHFFFFGRLCGFIATSCLECLESGSAMSETATSPPTSVAPQSDDEFTHLIVQHAAKQLGVSFENATYQTRTAAEPHRSPQSVPMHLSEILRQIAVREKALGPSHESIVSLHLRAAFANKEHGFLEKCEHHLCCAVDVVETNKGASEALVEVLNHLAQFYVSQKRYFDARVCFLRMSELCSTLERSSKVGVQVSSCGLKDAVEKYKLTKAKKVFADVLFESSSIATQKNSQRSCVGVQCDIAEPAVTEPLVSLDSFFVQDAAKRSAEQLRLTLAKIRER